MKIKWSSLLFNLFIWLALEITLTCLGFDDLADYSEFISKTKKIYANRTEDTHYTLAIDRSLAGNMACYIT